MDSCRVCFLVLLMGAAAFAQRRIPDIVIDKHFELDDLDHRVRCTIACRPGEFLHWSECRCVSIDEYFTEPPQPTDAAPTTCQPARCPLSFVPCSEYFLDSNGCQTCRCKCVDFRLQCPTDCKYGTHWTKDKNGCKVCACAPRPKICPPVCQIYCPFGNVMDSDGCPTCSCRPGDGLPW